LGEVLSFESKVKYGSPYTLVEHKNKALNNQGLNKCSAEREDYEPSTPTSLYSIIYFNFFTLETPVETKQPNWGA
jgi:hypothetical protein